MGKPRYSEGASLKDKKTFAPFLSEDEELIIVTGYGRTYLRQHFILQTMIPGAIFVLLGLGVAFYYKWDNLGQGLLLGFGISIVFSLLKTLWTYHAHRYLLTTRRVIIKTGVLSVKLTSALYDKITHIQMDQSLYDRLFLHHGMIRIHTAGSEKDELVLQYVESPIEFKNILERMINSERSQSGRVNTRAVEVEGEIIQES